MFNIRSIRILGLLGLCLGLGTAQAANYFDPANQPVGSAAAYTLTKPGLADGKAKIFRASFNDKQWWGDLESLNVNASGQILDKNGTVVTNGSSYIPNWSAKIQLDATSFSNRKIFTLNDSTGSAVMFSQIGNLSSTQQAALKGSQQLMDYLRGDRSKEGITYRTRATVLGDIIHSTPVYVEYDATNMSNNLVFVGANDGMLHAFNAGTGDEVYAYIPAKVIPNLYKLADPAYKDGHAYYVNGEMTVADVTFGTTHKKILVGGLGAGGQAFFALDISNANATTSADVTGKLLWEISDTSSGMANLGYSYSRPSIARMKIGTSTQWVVIVGNGYSNTQADGTVGDGKASLFILNAQNGSLIKEISTNSGSPAAPNGLSSPTAVDINSDGLVDYVYAGDLDGHLWRFDVGSSNQSDWTVAFSGQPFATLLGPASGTAGTQPPQPITIPPRVIKHPDGGLMVLVGTGRMLGARDTGDTSVQAVYGLHDRLNGQRIAQLDTTARTGNILVQQLILGRYNKNGVLLNVRTSTAATPAAGQDTDGWLVDLNAGERVISPLRIRSGRLLFSTINPTTPDPNDPHNTMGEVWTNEINTLTGGAPSHILYDINEDGVLDKKDNIDGNGNGKLLDPQDRISGLLQGYGIVTSAPTTAILSATRGTFFINRQKHSQPAPATDGGPGLAGGHFDVDTSSFISRVGNGSTDGHVHQYDDKHDVTGVDYFGLRDPKLHNINKDITNASQKFKLIIVNADRSPGGRLVINKTYNKADPSTYYLVGDYMAGKAVSPATIYSLGGVSGSTQLTKLGIYFDVNAIINGQLVPTETDCVRSNTRSFDGSWRNDALTIWAVAVNPDGSDAFVLDKNAAGKIVGIKSGLLWESTLFWHWEGPCANEYKSTKDTYKDSSGNTVFNTATNKPYTIFEYYRRHWAEIKGERKRERHKRRRSDDHEHHNLGDDQEDRDDEDVDKKDAEKKAPPPVRPLDTVSRPAWLRNPYRVSWGELLNN